MFHSYNSHIVTRAHVSIVNQLVAGEITTIAATNKLQAFEVDEAFVEMHIHDIMNDSLIWAEYDYTKGIN